MKSATKYFIPRLVLAAIVVVLFLVQWIVGDFPQWLFAMPMNLLVGVLWLLLIWEGYRYREQLPFVKYLLSAEASYIALAVAATLSVALGLQEIPVTSSWIVVGGFIYVQTTLTLVILRGWRNEKGVRWRFLMLHCGLWLAVMSALLGAPDKEILRVEMGYEPTREAIDERGKKRFLDYELRLEKFEVENTKEGTPQMFRAEVAVDDKVVDIEVNSPYSQRYGEDIYLVSYEERNCILQIVRERWRGVSALGISMLLLGAFMLFLQGFGGVKR